MAKSQMGAYLANRVLAKQLEFLSLPRSPQSVVTNAPVMMQFKTLRLPQIRSLAMNCITKMLENFQVVQFSDGLSFWSIFVVHYSSAVKKRQSASPWSWISPVMPFLVLAMMDVSTAKTELSFQGHTSTPSFHLQLSQCSGIRDCHP